MISKRNSGPRRDKLRSTLDAAQYKHTVLGLIFLKYVSDAFRIRQDELRAQFQNPDDLYYLDPADFEEGAEGRICSRN